MAALAKGRSWLALIGRPMLLMGGLLVGALVFQQLTGSIGTDFVDRFVAGRGSTGEITFVLAGAAACAVGLPRQGVAFAGGYAFGLPGALLALIAQIIGCAATFGWARVLGRDWATRRVQGRVARANRFLAANPFTATLTMRLLPVGSNMALNLLAGVSTVAAAPFLLASLVGYVPQTAVFALLGSGVKVERTYQLVLAGALFCGAAVLGIILFRRRKQEAEMATETDEAVRL